MGAMVKSLRLTGRGLPVSNEQRLTPDQREADIALRLAAIKYATLHNLWNLEHDPVKQVDLLAQSHDAVLELRQAAANFVRITT